MPTTSNTKRKSSGQSIKRRRYLAGAVAVGSTLIAGCTSSGDDGSSMGSGGGANTIKIGAIYPLSGSLASIGATCRNGWEYGVKWVNSNGGVEVESGTAKLELVWGDSESKQSVGVAEAKRLISQKNVDMVVGCYQSSVTLPVSQVCERNRVPFYTPISVANKITERGFNYLLRQNVKTTWIGRDFVRVAADLSTDTSSKISTVGLLYENTDYGQSSADGVRKYLGEYAPKWEIVSDYSYPHNATSVDSTISKLKQDDPDVLFGVHYLQDGILIANTMEKLSWQPKMYLISGAASDPGYIKNLGKTALGFMPAGGWNIRTVSDEIVNGFAQSHDVGLSYYSGFPFTAANVIEQAIEKHGKWNPDGFIDTAKQMTFKGSENVMAKPIEFNKAGQNVNASRITSQFQMIDGSIEKPIVWPAATRTSEPIIPIPPFSKK
jgi:branched-chain amino acid transport system substrate-binding protein